MSNAGEDPRSPRADLFLCVHVLGCPYERRGTGDALPQLQTPHEASANVYSSLWVCRDSDRRDAASLRSRLACWAPRSLPPPPDPEGAPVRDARLSLAERLPRPSPLRSSLKTLSRGSRVSPQFG